MTARRVPSVALLLLRRFGGRYRESLEGDMLEEFASGRSLWWCWQQVASTVLVHASAIVRKRLVPFLAATLFFAVALWSIAPATAPLMDWARKLESLRVLIQLAWLAGVPFLLGGLAGAAERSRRVGAILLGAGLAYMTPITTPFDSAVCDLCVGPGSAVIPGAVRWLTPFGSALLAGLGAWIATRISRIHQESPA
jgi:hypothetical protein